MSEITHADICGRNPVFNASVLGCGKPILTCAEVYRCVDCQTPFHKDCLHHHCANELKTLRAQLTLAQSQAVITEDTSDGYHTFKELYGFRKVYNAALFNEWASIGIYDVKKSWKHSDGQDCFGGGWFIVQATLPSGQISNHYKAADWDLFKIPEGFADKYDGHTSTDVLTRLSQLKPHQSQIPQRITPPFTPEKMPKGDGRFVLDHKIRGLIAGKVIAQLKISDHIVLDDMCYAQENILSITVLPEMLGEINE